jgi:hypothetical protein
VARRSKRTSPATLLAAILLVAVIVVAGILFAGSAGSTSQRTTESIDVPSYLENASMLRGNVYKVEGRVDESLAWDPDTGRLISLEADGEFLPLLVPASLKGVNIQKEQRLRFIVEVDGDGILLAKEVEKQ